MSLVWFYGSSYVDCNDLVGIKKCTRISELFLNGMAADDTMAVIIIYVVANVALMTGIPLTKKILEFLIEIF